MYMNFSWSQTAGQAKTELLSIIFESRTSPPGYMLASPASLNYAYMHTSRLTNCRMNECSVLQGYDVHAMLIRSIIVLE